MLFSVYLSDSFFFGGCRTGLDNRFCWCSVTSAFKFALRIFFAAKKGRKKFLKVLFYFIYYYLQCVAFIFVIGGIVPSVFGIKFV